MRYWGNTSTDTWFLYAVMLLLCRGRGIMTFNDLPKLLKYIDAGSGLSTQWIVQKYMENPLILCKRKFDLRQYVLSLSHSHSHPLRIIQWQIYDCIYINAYASVIFLIKIQCSDDICQRNHVIAFLFYGGGQVGVGDWLESAYRLLLRWMLRAI